MRTVKEQKTRARLLEAAMVLFAERGFEKTTLAAISERAAANIAAVNYHFGDKQHLYVEALRAAWVEANACFPVVSADETASPEARLRHHIHAMLAQIFCPSEAGYLCRMVAKEFAEPTFAVDVIFSELISRHRVNMRAAVAGILGPDVSEQRLHMAVVSIVAQMQFYNFTRLIREIGKLPTSGVPNAADIAEHIYQFSLAGLRGISETKLQ